MKIQKLKTFYFFGILFFIIIFLSSLINLYEKKNKIVNWLKNKANPQTQTYDQNKKRHYELAKDIINGGYILFFRHAEREKWIDVKKYDAMEMLYDLRAEDEYFSKAVCLSDRGLIQAKAIGKIIKELKLPYHIVVSSPSCRARQTAELAFGGHDDIKNTFMHYGPFYENEDKFAKRVKEEILKIKTKKNSNIIISAHNGVVRSKKIFDEIENKVNFSNIKGKFMEEGGFIVMKKEKDKLIFVDLFFSFHKFHLNFRERPLDTD